MHFARKIHILSREKKCIIYRRLLDLKRICFGQKPRGPPHMPVCGRHVENALGNISEIELFLSIAVNRSNLLLYIPAAHVFRWISRRRWREKKTIEWLDVICVQCRKYAQRFLKKNTRHINTYDRTDDDEEAIMYLCTVCCNRNWNTNRTKKGYTKTEWWTKRRNSNRQRCEITHT